MEGNEPSATTNVGARRQTLKIASRRHLLGFLLIGGVIVVLGAVAQYGSAGPGGTGASNGQLGAHSQAIHVYLGAILMDWVLLYYCWAGIHRRGGDLTTLSGERWRSWQAIAIDVSIALPFWAAWEGAAYGVHWLLGPTSAKAVDALLPQSPGEILLWIFASMTAGICEELAFRGYLQRQFRALTGSGAIAVLGQGVVFGLFHFYQGWKNVIVISVLGVLFGLLAAWRGNLRANVLAHAWADVWGGWLKFVIWS